MYDNENMRAVDINGVIFFVLSDLCKLLDLDFKDAVEELDIAYNHTPMLTSWIRDKHHGTTGKVEILIDEDKICDIVNLAAKVVQCENYEFDEKPRKVWQEG